MDIKFHSPLFWAQSADEKRVMSIPSLFGGKLEDPVLSFSLWASLRSPKAAAGPVLVP